MAEVEESTRPKVKRSSKRTARRSWWGRTFKSGVDDADDAAAIADKEDIAALEQAIDAAATEDEAAVRPKVKRTSERCARRSFWGKKETLVALDAGEGQPKRGRGVGVKRSDEKNARRSWWGGKKEDVRSTDEVKELEEAFKEAEQEDS